MRILFITGSLNQGGAEYQILELARLFRDKSHEVEVFAITDYDFYLPFIQKNELIYTHLLNSQSKLKRVFLTAKKIKHYQPDLIITYLKVPSQVTLVAKWIAMSKAKFISGERTSFVQNKDKIHFKLMQFADAVTVNSISRLSHLSKQFPKLKNKLSFFPNIVNVKKFILNKRKFKEENVIKLGFVGRISPEKNVLNLVKSFHEVSKKYSFIELELYGDARNPEYLEEIKNYIKENKLQKSVFLRGRTDNVMKVYQNIDVLCLLSDYEGFSNVLSEALCSGLPIITSNIPENTFLVKNLENGFTVNQKDINCISVAIEKMLKLSKDDFQHIKLNNRNKAEHIFDKEKIYADYMTLIKEIM